MTSWVIGDIHGCAAELEQLLEQLVLGSGDQVVCVGDLFHRGPDPGGVLTLLRQVKARSVRGNHELAMLSRGGEDLRGDGGSLLHLDPSRAAELRGYLVMNPDLFLYGADVGGAPTPDGREWLVVHAGLPPGKAPEVATARELVRTRRLDRPGRPFWYEHYRGPTLVLYGHTRSTIPRPKNHQGRLVALGLDTGCVFGGHLTAYSPDEDRFVRVPALESTAIRTQT